MGQTRKVYPVVEVAVLLESKAPLASGHERAVEGDIIAVRPPNAGVGMLEMHRHLWLRLAGWEEGEIATLTEGAREGEVRHEKRRYRIPLARLKQIKPDFDEAKARSTAEVYQPFLTVDEDTGLFTATTPPLDIHGLVLDTATGRYK